MAMTKFVPLHVHSHYSLLEALPKIPDLVKAAKKAGMEALALTDSGNLYGAVEFYRECKAAEIKPIIGVDFYLAARTRHDKEARIDNELSRLVLLAMDATGYKNLLKLVSYSYLEGFYYKPRIDKELLEKFGEGLLAISPKVPSDKVWWQKTFSDRFFIGVGRDLTLAREAEEAKIPIVAAPEIYYLTPEDRPARDTVLSIQSFMGARSRSFDDREEDYSFVTPKIAKSLYKEFPEALQNNEKIVEMCNPTIELGQWVFPSIDLPKGADPDEEFSKIVFAGIEKRGLKKTKEVLDRIEYELGIIKKKGFARYFLVVFDLVRFAHDHGILANIRGSVSGSMATYLSGITNINPLDYDIPFERFLNPDRPSPPDIDMDFADNRRDEIIEYAKQKYGSDHVAQIGTFGTMMARGAVRDATRAMGFPVALGDKIAKLIPMGSQGFAMTIERAKKENPDFLKLYKSDPEVERIVDMAEKIEGNARHISVHAAGLVISPEPLMNYVPLQYDTKGEQKIITQYDMYSLDPNAGGDMTVGLLKFDVLGIRNLAIISEALARIKKIEGKDIKLQDVPLNDKLTFQMLARGETEGTFQLNGSAMTRFLVDLKPTNIHDINAMVALFRPGPMQFIPLFIERKHNPSLVRYLDPVLKPILEKTYGVLVYQDDLLMIAKDVAGYSWGEVDKFRKAVGKKIPEEMLAQKEKFIKGVVEHSKWPKQKAEELWGWIEPFAAYGFNKAHSVSYGWVAYITAYLKANFPEIYMSAVLTAESGDVETIGTMVEECKRMGIEVLPPSVNESFSQFTVPRKENPKDRYKIRFGLVTIKNFGQGVASAIIDERKKNGPFTSLADFLSRVKDKNLNKKSLESLIKAGALDEFGERGLLLANLDKLLAFHKENMEQSATQTSLFGASHTVHALRLDEAPPAGLRDKLTWEKDLLGLYLSGHPLEEYRTKLEAKDINIKKLEGFRENTECVIGGLISEVRDVLTKGNERMVFIRLQDLTGDTDVVVFPRVYNEYKNFISPDAIIAIKGKVSKRNGETSFIAEKIKAL